MSHHYRTTPKPPILYVIPKLQEEAPQKVSSLLRAAKMTMT